MPNCLVLNWPDWITAIAGIATAVGVLIAGCQIKLAKEQSVTQFEDSMSREYRDIASRLPTSALLGEELDDEKHNAAIDEFFHYIDLSNEQVFLRQHNRISTETWENWRDGIKSNLRRPAFKRAWNDFKQRAPGSFSELRRLEESGFDEDPVNWCGTPPIMRSETKQ